MSIPGNAFDRQHARRDSDELHNDSRNLAISLAILRSEGIEKIGSEEPLQALLLPCFSRKARGKVQTTKKCLMCVVDHALGIWTCFQGMTIPSYLSSEKHLQKFPDQTEFQS